MSRLRVIGIVVEAKKVEDTLFIWFANNGVTTRIRIPIASDKDVYVSLTGKKCTISNIKVSEPVVEPEEPTPLTITGKVVISAAIAVNVK